MERENVVNFGAGPSALPLSVLQKAAAGLLNYNGSGIGLAELSHRSKEFAALLSNFESAIRKQLDVPKTHHILFTQGGGTGQFSSVVLNLLARHTLLHPDIPAGERVMDYLVTGSWSKKAAAEAKRLGGGKVNIVADGSKFSADSKSFDAIPPHNEWKLTPNAAFIYYCENETVDGVQFAQDESSPSSFPYHLLNKDAFIPLVADYSSSFMSRSIPRLADHALIFAGAQKNLGPSGLTVLIVREDLLVDVDAASKLGAAAVPVTLSYKVIADGNSVYNTPPMFSMYVSLLVLEDIDASGGLAALQQKNKQKQEALYAALEGYAAKGLLSLKVKETSRSWMNATFVVNGDDGNAKFVAAAEKAGLKQLKGHRSVGGIRASLYNAISQKDVDRLIEFMQGFFESK